ncbi:hypothetical protein DEQ92_14105 [Haloferax sp. Atlit-6N]|uniref:STT3 domain-containing protein n=1 Tax=Haloferax sp. Atlit-6N TaxID=2077205 RepID=UPI000E280650|nr:STT3 domain-containing protein [Haloferax sp. Atlit-6N]REA02035.1 hypothetical protein DEQ92_14105 [Haloferax sp. Atlit-6N]
MSEVWEATNSLLTDRPEIKPDLQQVLEIDAQDDVWTFDDLDIGSGLFGELVSRGIVEKANDGYKVADPAAVRAALDGEQVERDPSSRSSSALASLLPPSNVVLPFLGVIGFVLAFRLLAFESVFRGSDVVLLGNDPYYYRYWLFRTLSSDASVLDLPYSITAGEPFLIATLLGVTEALGGGIQVAELVLSWYPVVAALITATATYLIAYRLTANQRVALAAVAVLAVTPVHAYRTAIGFADHHAFDYIWLAITAFAALKLVDRTTASEVSGFGDPTRIGWTLVLGVGVCAQVLAWNAGPLLLLPLGVYGVVRSLVAAKHDSGLGADLSLVFGIALGAVLSMVVHLALNWQRMYIILPTFLLAIGLGLVFGLSQVARSRKHPRAFVLLGICVAGGAILLVAFQLVPTFGTQFVEEVTRLIGGDRDIVEVKSIFSPTYGTITGPIFFFGLSLFFSLWYCLRSVYTAYHRNLSGWLLIGSYTGLLFTLALLQVRFAGALAMFAAVYGGLALVDIIALIGVGDRVTFTQSNSGTSKPEVNTEIRLQMPSRQTIFAVSAVFLLISGLGVIMTPLRVNQLAVDDTTYNAATWMDQYSEQQEWEYPQNYVLSHWGQSRVYNGLVNNQSRSYQFSYENYDNFLVSTDATGWFNTLNPRTGFIVVEQNPSLNRSGDETIYNRLYNGWGSNTAHYRAMWVSADGTKKVFTLVPGARVTGSTAPDSQVTARGVTTVSGNEVSVTYQTRSDENGTYQLRIPQPGNYTIQDERIRITDNSTTSGAQISITS